MLKKLKNLYAWLAAVSHALATKRIGLRVEVELDGRIVTAHEATVFEIRNWLQSLVSAKPFDVVDAFLFESEEVTVSDLVRLSDASRATIESLPPSLLVKLAQAVKEANPFFFQFRQTLTNLDKLPSNA